MSSKETIRVDNRIELDRIGSPLSASDDNYTDLLSGEDGADKDLEDIEKTAPSSAPLPPPRGGHGSLLTSIRQWALALFLPAISIAYLAFCYAVHYRVVPANMSAFSPLASTQLLTNLGSAVTTINIIIISLALVPLKAVLYELKSEELFRLLSAPKNSRGVELSAVNDISNSSYGFIDSIAVVVNRRCSPHYVMAFVAAGFIWAVSTLAPAALSIQPILIDGALMAFPVGTIPSLAFYQPVASGQTPVPSAFSPDSKFAASIVWAEQEAHLSYSASVSDDPQGLYTGFIVPSPNALNSTVSARWLTDVVGLNPYCAWANPVNLTATSLNVTMNSTKVPTTALSVHLEGADLRVSVPSSYFPTYTTSAVTMINVHDPTLTVVNYTTGSLPTDGSMVMSVIQCTSTSCTEEAINIIALFVDFANVPSLDFATTGADYKIGFLVCKPNITIETREIRTQGSMSLQVQPLAPGASPHPRQGNLDWTQTSLLLSYSLSTLTLNSGPASSAFLGLGSITQVDFMFGSDQINSIPSGVDYENTSMVLTPLSTDQLARGYTEMVKSSMKPYVSGSLGTSYVPGRVASVEQIFVSSMPHVIALTALVAVLLGMAAMARFRRGRGDQFNLTNVAAALADSELLGMAKRAKMDAVTEVGMPSARRERWSGDNVGERVARRLRDLKVSLRAADKGGWVDTLYISRA